MCSPIIIFNQLNEYWLDSGYIRFRKNKEALTDFCTHFMDSLKRKMPKTLKAHIGLTPKNDTAVHNAH